jgi:hypothetical protein
VQRLRVRLGSTRSERPGHGHRHAQPIGQEAHEPGFDLVGGWRVAPCRQLGVEGRCQEVADDAHEAGCRVEQAEVRRVGGVHDAIGEQPHRQIERVVGMQGRIWIEHS